MYLIRKYILPTSKIKSCNFNAPEINCNAGSVDLSISHVIDNYQIYMQKHNMTIKIFEKEVSVLIHFILLLAQVSFSLSV